MDKIENHLIKCFDARKASDWSTVIRESEGAVAAGADSAPQVREHIEAYLIQVVLVHFACKT